MSERLFSLLLRCCYSTSLGRTANVSAGYARPRAGNDKHRHSTRSMLRSKLLSRTAASAFRRYLSTEAYAVTPYRKIMNATDAQREAWAKADKALHAQMAKYVPAALKHNGEEAFDQHLVGVQSVLRAWGAEEHLCNAALFHSIYGTEGFQGFSLPLSHRGELAELIGPKAERLAWIFCMVDRATVDATLPSSPEQLAAYEAKPPTFYSRSELGAFAIPLKSKQEWIEFLTLTLADWLEQVEGASTKEVPRPVEDGVLWPKGEAWAYRREAYARMAELLGEHGVSAASKMHAEVFAREPVWSRGIVQPLTPSMSPSAVAAAEAIASSKLDFA